ncbi:hypothetical protein ig2599ANME_0277 [groundwater metagenome]
MKKMHLEVTIAVASVALLIILIIVSKIVISKSGYGYASALLIFVIVIGIAGLKLAEIQETSGIEKHKGVTEAEKVLKKQIPKAKFEPSISASIPKDTTVTEQTVRVPSVSEFLRFYNDGNYIRAIFGNNPPPNPTLEQISDAIDRFEMEHSEKSSEWSIPMAKIKEALLKPKPLTKPNEQKVAVDPHLRKKAESKLAEATTYYNDREFKMALEKVNEAIKVDPLFAKGYKLLGDIYRRKGESEGDFYNFDSAVKWYNMAIEIEPTLFDVHNVLGLCYVDIGGKANLENAVKEYQKALESDPPSATIKLNKMELEIRLEQYKDVLGTYGEWHSSFISEDEVKAASLICIALALDGKPYEDYIDPLLNTKIKVHWNWSTFPIDNHLVKLEKEGYFPDRIAKAKEIQDLFKEHYR